MDKISGGLSGIGRLAGEVHSDGHIEGGLSSTQTLEGGLSGARQLIGGLSIGGSLQGVLSIPSTVRVNNVLVGTTEEWNSKTGLIGAKNIVYVYTDRSINEDGQAIPGFKVGDGLAYLIDLPFNDDIMMAHIQDSSVHITDEERLFWNNKVTAYLNVFNQEELVLTKD